MTILLKSFVFNLLFILINCTCSSYDILDYTEHAINYIDDNASAKSCPQREFSELEKQYDAYKCCYQEAKCNYTENDEEITVNYKACAAATKEEYDLIDETIKEGKEKCSDIVIDCPSTSLSYIYLYLVLLFLL